MSDTTLLPNKVKMAETDATNTHSQQTKRVKTDADVGTLAALNAGKWAKSETKRDTTHASLVAATDAYIQARSGTEVKVCPYLDTIDRKMLDFDFERLCSVTLTTTNIYACLVCGKYFQGRGKGSPAYTHTLEMDHRVFVNLHTERFYCLPDGYLIEDPSLDDIRYNINPVFTKEMISKLGNGGSEAVPGFEPGTNYVPGLIGLNNFKRNDWLNVVVLALSQVTPIRNFLLQHSNTDAHSSPLVQALGLLFRKMWNPRAFKPHVSPHVFLQTVSELSDRKFRPGVQCDVAQFLIWLLNQLHKDLGGTTKRGSSIIHTTFQGDFRVEVVDKESKEQERDEDKDEMDDSTSSSKKMQIVPFMVLPIQLPFAPVFAEAKTRSLIHQVKLLDLLEKFSGKTYETLPDGSRKTMYISRLPKYLWVHVKRFSTNDLNEVEKNNTLVTFPLENLSLVQCVYRASLPTHTELMSQPVPQLLSRRAALAPKKSAPPVEKSELVKEILSLLESAMVRMRKAGYSLVANIVHEGTDIVNGTYYCHILNRITGNWHEVRDLSVTSPEGLAQLVALSQSYIQLYELKQATE